ncbi:uncharacterized protein LOC106770006 [Vigna radiata var. radiata]|uniref:Uncharacterized protein LOC106770006 n=1 Tax=Vigna radiata var. radiata TaxID=3916 RepID=A0A3Q0FA26_VIGRR|nr:uncharacterized protein LOC106770006 [Vigna radiata var. radiata]
MSIPPPNDPSRGCSSGFSQPLGQQDIARARNFLNNVTQVNSVQGNLRVVYRTGDRDLDIRRPVHRWDNRPYQEIFANGFQAWPQGPTRNDTYYNLLHFIEHAGAPLDTRRPPNETHVFVSTTLNNEWQPNPSIRPGSQIQYYRYEIYAPGGIWVAVTLGDRYSRYVSQAEICFVRRIAPQYIRSCLIYTATREAGSRFTTFRRETRLVINRNFNPVSAPYNQVVILNPVYYYRDEDGDRFLPEETYPPLRKKRQALEADNDAVLEWYTTKVVEVPSYIDSAFRSSRPNEVYFFLKNMYVRVYYTPGVTDDKILTAPRLICDGYPSLSDTPFGEYGIDCAFDTEASNAYIFSTNLCAYIDYAPGTMNDKILSGPMTIAAMFPVLKNTVFENGIDSAFRSTKGKEVYLFKNNKYGRIAYDSKQLIGTIRNISDGFPVLKGTIFESGIDACFPTHKEGEAYLFKGEMYVRIHFTPDDTRDTLLTAVQRIVDFWPSLKGILPRDNKGLDAHYHQQSYPHQHEDL